MKMIPLAIVILPLKGIVRTRNVQQKRKDVGIYSAVGYTRSKPQFKCEINCRHYVYQQISTRRLQQFPRPNPVF